MKHANTNQDACALCASHYGNSGRCDEGKPVASPHRAEEKKEPLPVCSNCGQWVQPDRGDCFNECAGRGFAQ